MYLNNTLPTFPFARGAARAAALCSLMFFAQSLFAQQFTPPEEISLGGSAFKLVDKQAGSGGRGTFEYTANGDAPAKAASRITINYSKRPLVTAERWLQMVKSSFDVMTPKPQYQLSSKDGSGIARFVTEAAGTAPGFEANVYKSFHLPACDGVIVFQYAVKHPRSADQSEAEKAEALKAIVKKNEQQAEDVERAAWAPKCGA